jgi:hypothetical protein
MEQKTGARGFQLSDGLTRLTAACWKHGAVRHAPNTIMRGVQTALVLRLVLN